MQIKRFYLIANSSQNLRKILSKIILSGIDGGNMKNLLSILSLVLAFNFTAQVSTANDFNEDEYGYDMPEDERAHASDAEEEKPIKKEVKKETKKAKARKVAKKKKKSQKKKNKEKL